MESNTNIYIAVGIIGVLIVMLISQCINSDLHTYSDSDYIMVKTEKGIIKLDNKTLADEIYKIIAKLDKNQYAKIEHLVDSAIEHLNEFIEINPINGGAQLYEIKSKIIYDIESDDLSGGVMSDVNSTIHPYDKFIKKLKIVHVMLQAGLCNGGLIDYKSLSYIVRECTKVRGVEYENDVGNTPLPKTNRAKHSKMSHFKSVKSQPSLR